MPLGTVGILILQYKYFVLVPLILLAQPLVGTISGLLVRLDFLELMPVYLLLVGVTLVGDVLWYWVGYHWGERFVRSVGKYVSITPAHVESTKRVFHRYHAPILLVSKVINGLGASLVVLFTAGLTRVPFGRYMLFNTIGETVWSAMILSVGYFFGEALLRITDIFGRVVLGTFFVLFILVLFGVGHYVRNHLRMLRDEE